MTTAEDIINKLESAAPKAFELTYPKLLEALKHEYRKVPLVPEEQSIAFIRQSEIHLEHTPQFLTGNKRVDAFRIGQIEGKKQLFHFIKKWREQNEMGTVGVGLQEANNGGNTQGLSPVHDIRKSEETGPLSSDIGNNKQSAALLTEDAE